MSELCEWVGTVARGVYMPSCRTEGVMGVPPKPGADCPHCGRIAISVHPQGRTASIQDFREWQAEQKKSGSESGESK